MAQGAPKNRGSNDGGVLMAPLKISFLLRSAAKVTDFTQNPKNLLTILPVWLRDFSCFVLAIHFFARSRYESNF